MSVKLKDHHVKIAGNRITAEEAESAYKSGKTVTLYSTKDFNSGMAYAGEAFGAKYVHVGQTLKRMKQLGRHPDAVYTLNPNLMENKERE